MAPIETTKIERFFFVFEKLAKPIEAGVLCLVWVTRFSFSYCGYKALSCNEALFFVIYYCTIYSTHIYSLHKIIKHKPSILLKGNDSKLKCCLSNCA